MCRFSLLQCWKEIVRRWRLEFHVFHASDSGSAQFRARHLQTMGRLTPLMMAGNLAGGTLLVTALSPFLQPWQTLPWLAALLAACGAGVANWSKHLQRPRSAVSPVAIRRAVRGASSFALLWAVATMAWLPSIPPQQQLLLATLMVGMMCGGAFSLASLPQAAASYLAIMAGGAVLGLMRSGGMANLALIVMVVLYGLLLCLCVFTTARIYTARLISEREAGRQSELVEVLLRDFEEHSDDMLWEIGGDGRFTRASDRLAAALSTTARELHGSGLLEVLLRHLPIDQIDNQVNALAMEITAGRPFRCLTLPVQTASGPRWWSLTAKPLRNPAGKIEGWRGVMADVTIERQARATLQLQARSDSLTGLANRLQLREHLAQSVQGLGESTAVFALICLDVDHFKAINDAMGHTAGDAVLIEIANRLKASLREVDLAARVGGDEFSIVVSLPDGVDEAHAIARRLVAVLGQSLEDAHHVIPLSVSMGMAIAPQHGATLDELAINADLALYEAKERGRGRYEVFAPVLGDRHRRRVLISQQLRGALARGEFSLDWQPQVDIDSWNVVGTEVLLRWRHPTLGNVSPAEFVSSAEESGQINAIGAWVLEQACLGAAQLPNEISVSVNASTVQLLQDDFVAVVSSALARSGLPANRLKIEITESLFMDATSVALSNLHGLRELGVGISLDDFGTGFSSLAYLLRFPFDVLKIDRTFVLEMMARDEARALVRSIVDMAGALGMGTVAEGVEDIEQLDVLRQAGCQQIQGYLVARPMQLDQLHQLIGDWQTAPIRGSLNSRPQDPICLAA